MGSGTETEPQFTRPLSDMPTRPGPGIVVLVCGGRGYDVEDFVYEVLDAIHAKWGVRLIVQGWAGGVRNEGEPDEQWYGADRLAARWADSRGVPHTGDKYQADWGNLSFPDAIIRRRWDGRRYDVRAGYRRNALMLEEERPELVAAFPGGNGTAMMVKIAQAAGVRCACFF